MTGSTVNKDQFVFFDMINNRLYYSDGSGKITKKNLPLYLNTKLGIYKCSESGFYPKNIVSASDSFISSENLSVLDQTIQDSIDDLPSQLKESVFYRGNIFALVPDAMDEYSTSIRGRLNYRGRPILLIPRSVLLAYSYLGKTVGSRQSFLCID